MMIGVIADDLTGANATGVKLSKQGLKTATFVRSASLANIKKYDAICLDTDSRYSSKETAAERVRQAIKKLKQWKVKIFCKRIDSTVRGNIGIEIDTMLHELGEHAVAIVVPSFPESGRVSVGGYLLVDGILVQETDVAKDPLMPVNQSFVPDIIQRQSVHSVSFIGLNTVLSGVDYISNQLKEYIEQGQRIIVIDAVNDEHIESIALAMIKIKNKTMIPVDPGPLTAHYARLALHQELCPPKILMVIGSITSLTGRQLHYLLARTNATPVYVNPEKLASFTNSWGEEVERATFMALNTLKKEDLLIITTYHPANKQINLKDLSHVEQVTEDALARRITDGLAVISRKVIENSEHPIFGCFTSGGDVTASLCAVGRANSIEIEEEILPLTSFGYFSGGYLDGLPVVTKGGMVGDQRTIYKSLKFLQMKINQKRSGKHVNFN
ncbi:four-carbon acid sugar kinase family protein [Anoxybacillus sp. LAT_38]|uniref:four-carbon acid sugar kinase family protein n=1 Tax=Anoxybacillus sp. LAT_26 TaxID=2862719 RepID=UPI001EECC0AB|nr:four-carbon acid sugar kinase family protein [Anoxybacillus sp. LAT_26]MCG6184583.1 four-carbon acid sugar kinase family protein [Anoxybacillus sp. LAT_26]MCG6199226.1 four-carbon acid sugar kinase family protein [Anoxybacillus sp. LAT_38]